MSGGRLEGKVALITGAGGGLGSATAELFVAEGARVALLDLDQAKAEAAAEATRAGDRVLALSADVSAEQEVHAAVRRVVSEFHGIDAVINLAGARPPFKKVTELDAADWSLAIDVNLMGAVHVAKYAIPEMVRGGGGTIVNVSSIGARGSREGWAPYDSTKAALMALSRDLACEFADSGIRVNTLVPGFIRTSVHIQGYATANGLSFDQAELELEALGANCLLGRQGVPAEIAHSLLFLSSPESSYITAACLCIDGGSYVTGADFRDDRDRPSNTIQVGPKTEDA